MPRNNPPPTGLPKGKKPPDETEALKAKVLEHYADCGTLLHACLQAGADYKTARMWKREDPAFALALQEAYEPILDKLEALAFKRATDGSDKILELMLKSLHEKYRDTRKIEHSGPGGGPIVIQSAGQVEAQIIAVAHQFPTVCPRIRQVLQNILDKLPKHD